jgi:hypothetical protein
MFERRVVNTSHDSYSQNIIMYYCYWCDLISKKCRCVALENVNK